MESTSSRPLDDNDDDSSEEAAEVGAVVEGSGEVLHRDVSEGHTSTNLSELN